MTYKITTMLTACFFQSCLVGILVPDPDVLPKHCSEKLKLTGSYEELCQNPVSGNFGHSASGGEKEFAGCVCVCFSSTGGKKELVVSIVCVCVSCPQVVKKSWLVVSIVCVPVHRW